MDKGEEPVHFVEGWVYSSVTPKKPKKKSKEPFGFYSRKKKSKEPFGFYSRKKRAKDAPC